MPHRFLQIHPSDNVCVALTDLPAGETLHFRESAIHLAQAVPAKHKFTTQPLQAGADIRMYGIRVGTVVHALSAGALLTVHNVRHEVQPYTQRQESVPWLPPDVSAWRGRTFLGYHRADGQVGVANYWLVIPLVFCENRNVEVIRLAFEEELGFSRKDVYKSYVRELVQLYQNGQTESLAALPWQPSTSTQQSRVFRNIEGIKFLTHQGGCGGIRQDSEALCALLAGYLHNPNVAGATILSLGCQNAQVDLLMEKVYRLDPHFQKPLLIFEQQKEGTEQGLLVRAIRETFVGLIEANRIERREAPLSKLKVGLECGGSDGFSGISANPAVGYVSDVLAALGGSTLLSEFPELCGVEQDLINRCMHPASADRFLQLMRTYARAAEAAGSGFDMNPSPGNIKDGLITDAMKSAGAAKKGGTSPIADVLDYGEYVTAAGLNLLCTPGNDVESTTAMAGAGASLILFTTGLGTPTGNPIAPVVKISSNSRLAQRMPDIIDINAGTIIDGTQSVEEAGSEILEYLVSVASGQARTKAQELGQDDFIPWKRGVSL